MARMKKVKKAARDYERSMLPQNRREVFFDVVKLQWSKLLRLSLFLLVCALPLLLIAVYEDAYILTLTEDASVEQSSVPALIAPLHIFCAVLSAPSLLIFFLGLSGVIRVIRQLCWGENATVFPDLMIGFRQNWKQLLSTGILFAVCYALAKTGWHSALATQADSVWLQGLVLGLFVLLIAPLTACCVAVIPVYDNSFGNNLRLAAYIFLKNPLKAVGAMLLAFGLSAAVWVIPSLELHLIGAIPAMAVFTLGLLGWTLFVYDQLDRHYNREHYPELVARGTGNTEPEV